MNNEHFAVRIWENYFELLMKIKSKSERNALCFALVYYGFHQTLPQDVKLKESTLLLFEAIKHNIIAKNQGGRKKRFNNGSEKLNKALSNNKADKQIADKQIADKQIADKKNFKKNSKKNFSDVVDWESLFDYWECWKEGGKYKNTESRNRMLAKLKELTGSDFELAKKVICDAIDHSWQGFCKGNQLFYKDETFEPPTFDEVKAYAWDRYRDDLAEKFFNYYAASDWRDGRGYPVKNWKLKFAEWETRNPDPDDSGYVPGAIDKIFS